jgi:hypothetical protein
MDLDMLERELTLAGAVRRFDERRVRDSMADPDDPGGPAALDRQQALELLALGELIARMAGRGGS